MDGFISPIDPLMVINYLNKHAGSGEGEGEGCVCCTARPIRDSRTCSARTAPLAGEAIADRHLVAWRRCRRGIAVGTTTVQTAVAIPRAAVAGYSVSVGYLPFAAEDLWRELGG